MKYVPLKMAAKSVILICFTLFVVLPVLVACVWKIQDWRYTRFCWRGQEYYARVADACDQLLNQNEPLQRKLKGEELEFLPALLKELGPTYAIVDTNSVVVTLGGGLMAHLIIWKPIGSDSCWELITVSPESRQSRVLFSKEKPKSANPASALDGGERILRIIERSRPAATD